MMAAEPESVVPEDALWICGQFYQVDLERRYLWRRLSLDELHDELDEIWGTADECGLLHQQPSDEWPSSEVTIRFTSGSDGEEVWAWFRDSKVTRSWQRHLLAEDDTLPATAVTEGAI